MIGGIGTGGNSHGSRRGGGRGAGWRWWSRWRWNLESGGARITHGYVLNGRVIKIQGIDTAGNGHIGPVVGIECGIEITGRSNLGGTGLKGALRGHGGGGDGGCECRQLIIIFIVDCGGKKTVANGGHGGTELVNAAGDGRVGSCPKRWIITIGLKDAGNITLVSPGHAIRIIISAWCGCKGAWRVAIIRPGSGAVRDSICDSRCDGSSCEFTVFIAWENLKITTG